MDNLRQRFFFPETDLRGEFVRLESALLPIFNARNYPLEIQSMLGESLAAACLMAGTLKFDGHLSLQAQGQGELSLLLAEATHDNSLRGLAQWEAPVAQGPLPSLKQLLGNEALMAVTIYPQGGQNYQSMVPLEGDTLADCLTHYFAQSEQLPTRLWLACGNGRAAGLLLQRLPERNTNSNHNNDQWQTLTTLADTLTTEELLSLPPETLLHRLFHELSPEMATPAQLRFACTCSRTKVETMLLSLGKETLQSLLDEQGEADIRCDFCQQNQHFDAVDLTALLYRL